MLQSFLYQFLFLPILVCTGEMGAKVSVDSYYLRHTRWYIEEIYTVKSLVQCTSLCNERNDWCFAYCYDKATMMCAITSMMISPFLQDSVENVTMCHTFLKKDLTYNSVISSSKKSGVYPEASVLSEGIYNFNKIETCAGLGGSNTIYIMFDLKKLYYIREIRITSQPDDWEPDLPRNAEIKIGKEEPLIKGTFTTFELFATMSPNVQKRTTYTFFSKDKPYVEGRYVSIIAGRGKNTLVVCYVQIFE